MAKKNTEYDIVDAFARIEDELIASMMRNLKHHRAEEKDEGYNWSQWQVEQLSALDAYKKRNAKKYGKEFRNINGKIDSLISMQRAEGNADQEVRILKAMKEGYQPPKASKTLTTQGEFFKMNDEKMNALIKATKDDFTKAEQAVLRRANDQYRKIIFNAQVYANSGAGTYEKAVDMATKDFLSAGINCIEYKNGARHTIKDYADMAIKTAAKRAYLAGEGEKRKEMGISTVIVNKRGNPCPKCLPFCGKVLIDDVWSGGKPSDGPYPLMSKAMELGLYHPRCKDVHTTYFEGISTPPSIEWTEEEIENLREDLKQENKKNYAARQAEKYARLATYALDTANRKMYKAREEEWKHELEELSMAASMVGDERVYFNPEADYEINIPEYSANINEILSQAARKVAEMGSKTMYEYSALVDLDKGEIVFLDTDKDEYKVSCFYKYLRENKNGRYAMIHNHNTQSEMSFPDVQVMANTKEIEMVASVTNNGIINVVLSNEKKTSKYLPSMYKEYEKEYIRNHIGFNYGTNEDVIALEMYLRDLAVKEFGKGELLWYGEDNM